MTSTEVRPRVIVGVDGSDQSRAALHWAAEYAHAVGGSVEAIMAWQIPNVYGYPVAFDLDRLESDATIELETLVREVQKETPDVEITSSVRQGHPAHVLLDASREAQALVVGSRGHGAFAAALLGSTSSYCVHHASCPVIVVRD